MARSKAASKKQQKQQQKRGVDFKKIKRKLGRKLPPPKNATNTEVKSKAIVLPEQSVASEKAGLAVSKKGLTLKELLQQTSHHNSKVRRDALMGLKDLFQKYPAELRSHRYAVIEKLRERIGDDDKVVRETLYQLLKTVVFPGCKEDNQGPFVSLMVAYIFNAMTHLAVDVRLMAFKFFDLVVQYYPPSFSLYADKVLQNYEDILRKNQFYLEDKAKLRSALAGLNMAGQKILHAFELDMPAESSGFSSITKKLKDLVPVLVNCFQDFFPSVHHMPLLDAQSFDCMHSILQSIDLVVGFFGYGIHQGKPASQLSYEGPDEAIWDHTISSLLLKKLFGVFPLNPTNHLSEKVDDRFFILNIVITEIFLRCSEWICPPGFLLEKFLQYIENALLGSVRPAVTHGPVKQFGRNIYFFCCLLFQSLCCKWQVIGSLVFFSNCGANHNNGILQAFTKIFEGCNPQSSLKLACLSAIEEMLIPGDDMVYPDASDPLFEYQITWIRALPQLLILLGDKHPSSSQVVLHLLLRLGQCANSSSPFSREYENMQYSLDKFYSSCVDRGDVYYGPFIRLSWDSQELAICGLYYFSNLGPFLLKSIAFCCLCSELEHLVLFRIIEVLHSAFSAGHIQIADYISFFMTLLSRFKVLPENIYPDVESDAKISNRGTFKLLTNTVCSCLSRIGDDSLVFQILEQVIFDQLLLKPPLDNACALLRVLVVLDCKPTRLSEQGIITLSKYLSGCLNVGSCEPSCIPEDDEENSLPTHQQTCCYYMLPCFFLFDRSPKLLKLVLNLMGSLITESSSSPSSHSYTQYGNDNSNQINAVVSALLLMHKDTKVRKIISSFKEEVVHILQIIHSLQVKFLVTGNPENGLAVITYTYDLSGRSQVTSFSLSG
ncbi:Ipi1 N domain-containing protein [Citrus sinensis]|uniref:Ipi1 N domain-containing protein n=1 Tax=Citrus sinensis TaxID=2711 RepID=A0ACB8JYY5_CITSI|nr:Ipi1 N domain-containing protein [Citrus sinensis]